jgi:uncharacterized protein
MKKIFALLLICFLAYSYVSAQQINFPKAAADRAELAKAMPGLAKQAISLYAESNREIYLNNLFRLQIVAEEYADANKTIETLRGLAKEKNPRFADLLYLQHELFAKSKLTPASSDRSFESKFKQLLNELLVRLDDQRALHIYTAFISRNGVEELETNWENSLAGSKEKDSLNLTEAIDLCKTFYLFQLYKNIEPPARLSFAEDDRRRYFIDDSVLIKTKEGITLSAVAVRKKDVALPQPTALFFTIYTNFERNLLEAKQSAAHGFVGIVADARGKRLSPDEIVPYEHEAKDVNAVIDWIVKQPWSDGQVGMYGGSYSGFAQWAAAKYPHPALKTIVPYVAAIPGQGLPMENNIFLNANYGWAFYVSNNKYLDNKTYFDSNRWNSLPDKWFESGVAYRRFDSLDGTPNKLFQRWLEHPSYDKYWQNMVPYKNEYSKINIPVLSITGYYDDGQISALHYLKEHYKYNRKADHYLIIGPYDHFGAQRGGTPVLRDYPVDPVAIIDTPEITYEWLAYVMRNGRKPALVKDKINYQVMGTNTWKHAPSLEKTQNEMLTLYLSDEKSGDYFRLSAKKPSKKSFIDQEVDLADRKTVNNDQYYPYPIIRKELNRANGLFFLSEPFEQPVSVSGTFLGELKAAINKKDMDIGIVLYEVMPDGRYFHLSYFLGRASYAKDMASRNLLVPGKIESIPFERTRMVAKQLGKGSRLLVVLNVNKNPYAQINYGTGREVSDESIEDAKTPLRIKWFSDSFVKIPVWK